MNRASVKLRFRQQPSGFWISISKKSSVERVVYRDGQNEYLLNGTIRCGSRMLSVLLGWCQCWRLRLSDYSPQGEADRILNASPKERREMVEDALGLKLYQHKKAESERKLREKRQIISIRTKSLLSHPRHPTSIFSARRWKK